MKKQSLVKASLVLGVAGIFSKFLGLFFRWPLIMLIGDEGIGYYQMSYPLYMFYIALASGIPIAISKIISEKNAVNDSDGIFQVVKESFILMIIIGIGVSTFMFFMAKPLIAFLKWDPKSYYSLIAISFAPIIISFLTVFRGFFQGMQNMNNVAISQIIEQAGRVVFGVGLAIVLLPKGIEFSAGGAALGATIGAILGASFLHSKYKKIKKEYGIRKVRLNSEIMGIVLKIAIPISLGATVGTIMNLIDSILVPQKLLKAGLTSVQSTILYAQLTGKASVITNVPLTLSMAICTSLIPIIAESYILKKKAEVKSKINMSMKLATVIAMPCAFGLFFLAQPVMKMIFPGRYEGFEILKYLSISIPFIILTQTTTSILQGTGNYIKPIINLLIGCVIKIILTWYLVPIKNVNIYGAVISSISAYVIASILNIITVRIKIKVSIDFYNIIIKPICAACGMSIVVVIGYLKIYEYTMSNGIACMLVIFIGALIYGILVILLKIFKIEEIKHKINRI